MKGMTLEAVARACNGTYYGNENLKNKEIMAVTTDSRNVDKDSLFIAICGERCDGHEYINSCYEKGALCCISEKVLEDNNKPYIKVDSSLQAIKDIARYYRQCLDIKVVGITGSVGKTSTKEAVASVLSTKYKVLKTAGNFNNELGLPLTIFRIREDDEIAVLEMGISDFGEMTRLTDIAKPDVCIITNIGQCHLENLKSRDGVLKAKTEIFQSMNKSGTVILNGDDDKLVTITDVYGKKPLLFGIDNRQGTYADNIENLGLEGMKASIYNIPSFENAKDTMKAIDVHIPIAGKHMVYNAMAAALAGSVFGLSENEIIMGINNIETIAGRNHIIKTDKFLILDDCYNANPVSMRASIDVISTAKGRKVCILGDMFELGDNEKELHYEIGKYIAKKDVDILITAGTLGKEIARGACEDTSSDKIYSFDTRDEMLDSMEKILKNGDNILVKASHGMGFAKVVDNLKKN